MNRTLAPIPIALGLCVALAGQDPTSRPSSADDVERAFARLRNELAAAARDADDGVRARQRELLTAFLAEHATAHEAAAPIVNARCRLGTLMLTDFDHAGARRQFAAALRHAPEADVDIRGRAHYGLAQALELAGERDAAAAQLRRTIETVRGTRYARFAEIALDRIGHAGTSVIGSAAPEFGPRLDIDGKPRTLAELAGKPACLLFCSARDARGLAEVRRWLKALADAKLDPRQVVIFVMHSEHGSLRDLATREQWNANVIGCDREFVDPALMALRIRELPSLVLVSPNGTAVARSPSERGLREALGRMRDPR